MEVRDKALSMAVQVVSLSLLAMLPSPIMFGAIIDTTCILWQQVAGPCEGGGVSFWPPVIKIFDITPKIG